MKEFNDKPVYTISVAAELAGISVHTLRMYEKEGLIIPYKKESNQRLYSELDIERIRCIRKTINEDKMTIEGIRHILSMIPCWALFKCSKKDQKNCEAYSGYTKPCWMFEHRNNVCGEADCRSCVVYNNFGDCASIKRCLNDLLT